MKAAAHLLSLSSVDDLNARLRESGSETVVSVDNFRPNFVVSGCDPHAEDDWDYVKIGTVVMRRVRPCTRYVGGKSFIY